MHECCAFALPRLRYATSGTMEVTALVERLAGRGIPVFHTIDAGPNVKVFTLADHEESVAAELGAAGAVLRVIRCAVGGPSTVVGMEEV
jgi:diphosphomevalonate decarboxylase